MGVRRDGAYWRWRRSLVDDYGGRRGGVYMMSNRERYDGPVDVISTSKPLTVEQAQALQEHWEAAHRGERLMLLPERPRFRRLTWRERMGIRLRVWSRRLAEGDYR